MLVTKCHKGHRFPVEEGILSLLHSVQIGSGAHSSSYPWSIVGCFLGGKAAGAWSWSLAQCLELHR